MLRKNVLRKWSTMYSRQGLDIAKQFTRRSHRLCLNSRSSTTKIVLSSKRAPAKPARNSAQLAAINFDQQDEIITVKVGNIILATGFDLFDARQDTQLWLWTVANVYTSLEFERLSNAAGPTGGKIFLRDGVTVPKSVGIVHCVGSRDKNYHNYCSAICCMQSLKFSHLVREKTRS